MKNIHKLFLLKRGKPIYSTKNSNPETNCMAFSLSKNIYFIFKSSWLNTDYAAQTWQISST